MGRLISGRFAIAMAGLALAACAARPAVIQAQGLPPRAEATAPPRPEASPAPAAQVPGVLHTTACGNQLAAPAALPPAGSPPFVWILEPCFASQGNSSTIENETYMYYIKLRPSQPSQCVFVPYDEAAEQMLSLIHI